MVLERNLKGVIIAVCAVALLPIVLLVSLLIFGSLSVAWFVSWMIVIVVLGSLAVVFAWKFMIKSDVVNRESAKTLDQVREYVLEAIVKRTYFDEIEQVLEESVREVGLEGHKERLYFLTYRGSYEKNVFSVIINMGDFETRHIKDYDPTEFSPEQIDEDVNSRAQRLVKFPEKMIRFRERKISNPILGTESYEKEPLDEDKNDADEDVK